MLQPPLGEWGMEISRPRDRGSRRSALHRHVAKKRAGLSCHGFTDFELEMEVYVAIFARRPDGEGQLASPGRTQPCSVPTVMRKTIDHALDHERRFLSSRVVRPSAAGSSARAGTPRQTPIGGSRVSR